jgi:hypothetical protein
LLDEIDIVNELNIITDRTQEAESTNKNLIRQREAIRIYQSKQEKWKLLFWFLLGARLNCLSVAPIFNAIEKFD